MRGSELRESGYGIIAFQRKITACPLPLAAWRGVGGSARTHALKLIQLRG